MPMGDKAETNDPDGFKQREQHCTRDPNTCSMDYCDSCWNKPADVLPAIASFQIVPVRSGRGIRPPLAVEGGIRFCHERDVKALKDAALARIAELEGLLSEARAQQARATDVSTNPQPCDHSVSKRDGLKRCRSCGAGL